MRNGILNEASLTVLKMQGVVGGVLITMAIKTGNLIQTEIQDRVISTDLDSFASSRMLLALVKIVTAIKAVLNGGYLNANHGFRHRC